MLRPIFGRLNHTAEAVISAAKDHFRTTFTRVDNGYLQRHRTVRTKNAIAVVKQSKKEDQNEFICHRAQQLELSANIL